MKITNNLEEKILSTLNEKEILQYGLDAVKLAVEKFGKIYEDFDVLDAEDYVQRYLDIMNEEITGKGIVEIVCKIQKILDGLRGRYNGAIKKEAYTVDAIIHLLQAILYSIEEKIDTMKGENKNKREEILKNISWAITAVIKVTN